MLVPQKLNTFPDNLWIREVKNYKHKSNKKKNIFSQIIGHKKSLNQRKIKFTCLHQIKNNVAIYLKQLEIA